MSAWSWPETIEACSSPEATACSAVLAWRQGRCGPDDVVQAVLDITGEDEEETRRLMEMAVRWHDRLIKTAAASRRPPFPWEPHLSR